MISSAFAFNVLAFSIIFTVLHSGLAHAAAGPVVPLDQFTQDPDKYYSNPKNVGQCPTCDQKYFNDPLNFDKNLDSQKLFFSTPGNAAKTPRGVQAIFKKLNVASTVSLASGSSDLVLDSNTGEVTNGKMKLQPNQYPAGTTIEALPTGGFTIKSPTGQGKTAITGFSAVSYDDKTKEFTMDGAKVHLIDAPTEGQTITASRDSNGKVNQISMPKGARYDFPDGHRRVMVEKDTSLFLDGRDVNSMTLPSISFSDSDGKFRANKSAKAWIQQGDLMIYASEGRHLQRKFPPIFPGSGELQTRDGSIVNLQTGKLVEKSNSIKERPIGYEQGTLDDRRTLVKRVQEMLNLDGAKLKEDGKFGSKTADAVKRFQERNGLTVTGQVDDVTLDKLTQRNGVALFNKEEQRTGVIRQLKDLGYNDIGSLARSKLSNRPNLADSALTKRLDTESTVPAKTLVDYYQSLADQVEAGKKIGSERLSSSQREKQAELMRTVPGYIYQAAAEAEQKYGVPIDAAKVLALAQHETGYFSSYKSREMYNFAGMKNSAGGFVQFNNPLDGARAFVDRFYQSSHYFQSGKYTMTDVSHTWCPTWDDGCPEHAGSWATIYNRYRALS